MGLQFALGRTFRTCEKFWELTDFSLVLPQKFSQDTKFPPQFLPLRFCALAQNLVKIKSKKPYKSFCYFLLLQKVESSIPYRLQTTKKGNFAESTAESTIPSPSISLDSFRKKGAFPSTLPPTIFKCVPKKQPPSLLGGVSNNSLSSKKSAGATHGIFPRFCGIVESLVDLSL